MPMSSGISATNRPENVHRSLHVARYCRVLISRGFIDSILVVQRLKLADKYCQSHDIFGTLKFFFHLLHFCKTVSLYVVVYITASIVDIAATDIMSIRPGVVLQAVEGHSTAFIRKSGPRG